MKRKQEVANPVKPIFKENLQRKKCKYYFVKLPAINF